MDKPSSFRVQTGLLPAGLGYAVVVTGMVLADKHDRFYETFTYIVGCSGKLLHFEAHRTNYESIGPDIIPDEALWKYAEEFAPAPVDYYLFENRDELSLSAVTGYEASLGEGSLHDVTRLFFVSEPVRSRVLEMMHTTHCKELEAWIKKFENIRQRYIAEDDFTR